ncbi:hypothetical protein [Rossellomorea marisflavi]|uniref:hypothetical protein n=1 Tax=Rossellomorea marisflavi TaxID=189381 RepID=UPI00114DD721|nr:hypothetical protein [Rossellomorea marisflavi]
MSGGNEFPLHGFITGSEYEISAMPDEHRNHKGKGLIEIKKRTIGRGYAKPEQLELVEEKKLKVGDQVRVIQPGHANQGKTLRISATRDSNYHPYQTEYLSGATADVHSAEQLELVEGMRSVEAPRFVEGDIVQVVEHANTNGFGGKPGDIAKVVGNSEFAPGKKVRLEKLGGGTYGGNPWALTEGIQKISTTKRGAKAGELILIVNAHPISEQSYSNGDVLTVEETGAIFGNDVYVEEFDTFVDYKEYEVIEKVSPVAKKKDRSVKVGDRVEAVFNKSGMGSANRIGWERGGQGLIPKGAKGTVVSVSDKGVEVEVDAKYAGDASYSKHAGFFLADTEYKVLEGDPQPVPALNVGDLAMGTRKRSGKSEVAIGVIEDTASGKAYGIRELATGDYKGFFMDEGATVTLLAKKEDRQDLL